MKNQETFGKIKVAIIHDWLVTEAGAEKVLERLINIFPQAEIFSIVDFLSQDQRKFIRNKKVKTSFIQRLPKAKTAYRNYLPLMPIAIEQFDLSTYDVVISSSYAVAKGVITGPRQLHICYCHSPIRYAWDLQHQYLAEANIVRGIKSIFARIILHYIRLWDVRTSSGVDVFVANSNFIAKRIWKVYRRKSTVIYPPVEVDNFTPGTEKGGFYLTASRLVPYKRVDLIVAAFAKMPDKKLIVIGNGPEMDKIRSLATPNIKILGYQSFESMRDYMRRAQAFIFAAEEDFGIVPVEAQACGTPVIAYGQGGSAETIIDGRTGILFPEQTVDSLIDAVSKFELNSDFKPEDCRTNALRFSGERFENEVRKLVNDLIEMHFRDRKNNNRE